LKFGFYDSGIGGLITLREIVERVGCFDVLYLAIPRISHMAIRKRRNYLR